MVVRRIGRSWTTRGNAREYHPARLNIMKLCHFFSPVLESLFANTFCHNWCVEFALSRSGTNWFLPRSKKWSLSRHAQSLCHEILLLRIPFPRDTLSGRGNQSTEMSDFLRSTLDLWVSQNSSFSDGPTLFFDLPAKPFQLRHASQHCQISSMHGDSQLSVFLL